MTFTVGSPPPTGSDFRLLVRDHPTRTNPRQLGGATLHGDAYVFVVEDTRVDEVTFELGGATHRREGNAP